LEGLRRAAGQFDFPVVDDLFSLSRDWLEMNGWCAGSSMWACGSSVYQRSRSCMQRPPVAGGDGTRCQIDPGQAAVVVRTILARYDHLPPEE
jgi:hypothetical protein